MNVRLLAIGGVTGLLSIALAGSAFAGGGGWPPLPGNYRASDTAAFASLSGPPTTVCIPMKGCGPGPSDFAYVSVDRGLHSFKPRGAGAPIVQQSGTMLSLDFFSVNGNDVSGCWIIPDGDFIVASDLSSATLSTTVPAASNCPGQPLGVGPANVITGKGGSGGGGGGSSTTLSVTWTYKGVVGHLHDDGQYMCGSFKTVAGSDLDQASATSQGQITGASETLTSDYAAIDRSSNGQVVTGTLPDACQ